MKYLLLGGVPAKWYICIGNIRNAVKRKILRVKQCSILLHSLRIISEIRYEFTPCPKLDWAKY